MFPVLFSFNGHPLTTWPVLALAGAWTAYFLLRRDLLRAGISLAQVRIFFLGAVAVWFAGAWLGQSFTVGRTETAATGMQLQLNGFVLYGGVLAVLAYGAMMWRLLGWNRKLGIHEMGDRGSRALLWALCLGRLGCTLYGCCYGSPSGSWPGMVLDYDHWDFINRSFPEGLRGVHLHPTPFYEALLLLLTALWAGAALKKGRLPPGVVGASCWVAYGISRFFLEFIRLDPRGEGGWGLSPSQNIAMATSCVGLAMVIWLWRYPRQPLAVAGSQRLKRR